MAKNKKVSTEENKKVPFNVFRKGAISLAIAGAMMTAPFMLAGCTEGKDGINGVDGTIWKAGTNYSEFTDAKVGDFFIDTDDYKLYQKTADSWVVVMNNYGKPAAAPVVTINNDGYWVIDGTATEHIAVATDGATPFIHTDGYWYIGDTDHPTGIKAQGQAGQAGKSAYELYKDANPSFSGTLADWFETLKGKDGAVWITGTEITSQESSISAEITGAKVGDLYFNSTTSDVYQCTATNTWKWISNTKGTPGNAGQSGVGITSVEQTYEVDETTGELYSVLTITYTEGEPDVIRTLAPKRIVSLEGITLGGYYTNMQQFAKVASENDAPELYLNVRFDDQTIEEIPLTDDMFVVDGYQYSIPDFTTAGSYNYKIKYMGKIYRNSINIVNIEDYSSHTITNINLNNSRVSTAFNKNNLVVEITYDMGGEEQNTTSVTVPLSIVAESYYSHTKNQALQELDMSVIDSYEITLKSAFAFDSEYDEDENPDTLYLSVYDANCNISYLDSVNNIVLDLGDADFEEKLKAERFQAYLNKPIDEDDYFYGNIEDLNYDLTNFDINIVGDQYIPFTYQLEGETGVYSGYIQVSVEADLDGLEALGTYSVDPNQCNPEDNKDMLMFTTAIGKDVTLYKVEVDEDEFIGVAVIDATQYSYDLTAADSGVLKLFDPFMNDWSYFKLTEPEMGDPAGKIGFYVVEEEITPTEYTCQLLMMGELFDTTVSIYGTEGTCKGKVSVSMPGEMFGSPIPVLMPYSTVDCTFVDSDNDETVDTIIFAGRTFTITAGNVLEEVTE